jgi:hypothetical protein
VRTERVDRLRPARIAHLTSGKCPWGGARAQCNSATLLRLGTYGRGVFELKPASGPLLSVQGTAAFSQLGVGHAADRIITLSNLGSANLNVTSFTKTAGSPDFSLVSGSTPVSIAPSSHANFTIRFLWVPKTCPDG